MPGPPPAKNRRRREVPNFGDWEPAPGIGWQHGDIPKAPSNLTKPSRDAWATWFHAWWASHWTPDNLPQIRKCISLFDAHERGESKAVTELRQWMDGLGITPYGQQKLRWLPPEESAEPAASTTKLPRPRIVAS